MIKTLRFFCIVKCRVSTEAPTVGTAVISLPFIKSKALLADSLLAYH